MRHCDAGVVVAVGYDAPVILKGAARVASRGAKRRGAAPFAADAVDAEDVAAHLLSVDVALRWLVSLRWHAVIGQVVTIAVAAVVLKIVLPVGPLLGLAGATAISNLALAVGLARRYPFSQRWLGLVVGADTLVLTALLGLAGGPANPFTMLYLALVALAAFMLDTAWTSTIVALVSIGYGSLIFSPAVRGPAHAHALPSGFTTHFYGVWSALILTSLVIAVIVRRLSQAVRDRQDALVRAQRAASRAETIASLGTLAAGAAHELSTPLGTIAVAANELEASIGSDPKLCAEDAALIRDEVERCRLIIQRMTARAGEQVGELPSRTTFAAIRQQILESVPLADRARVSWEIDGDGAAVALPILGVVQTLGNLVANALCATRAEGSAVVVEARVDETTVSFAVADRGPGIPAPIRDRLGDPFLTTKAPGEGLGLGIFLCQAFVDACRGELSFECPAHGGTRATVRLPRLSIEGR
ncbi:Sensor histidine kinase PrrB (RegB) [Minicystis rosea]|nr:Sensor histidine kinase PrrB (RegB) [Minicystis rosea]